MKHLIENEIEIVKAKDNLRNQITWNTQDAYNTINKYNMSSVNGEDFRMFLRESGFNTTQPELDRLFERF